jgi:5S rRNA maturation endonuclease (ribonuclease M5)
VLVRCFAGCRVSEIVRTLGLTMADLFDGPRVAAVRPQVVAAYPYADLNGEIIARKVRSAPKAFRWESPDPNTPFGWRSGFSGTRPGLYRLPELIDARQVVIVEGEKAVDCLRALGITATCPPAGASTWLPSWSEDLWRAGCADVIVLPDADVAGRRHAERVAATCYGVTMTSVPADMETPIASWPNAKPGDPEIAPLRVKLVPLPDLPTNGDVVDFLERRSIGHLQRLIEAAPYWTPDGAERQRRDRRREKAAERQRRRRARLRAERETFQRASRCECQGTTCHAVTLSRPANVRLSTLHVPEERTRTEHSQRDRVRWAA